MQISVRNEMHFVLGGGGAHLPQKPPVPQAPKDILPPGPMER